MNISSCRFLCPRLSMALAAFTGISLSTPTTGAEPVDYETGDSYPLLVCIVLNQPLEEGEDILVFTHQGREMRTCCFDCEDDLKKDYDSWILKVDDQIIQQQQTYYPLSTCVVDGKALKKTDSINFVFRNRLFLLCSFDCQEKLEQHPAIYFDQLDKAVIEKQKPNYPLTTCIVTGKPLGDHAIDHVVGNQLIRLFDSGQLRAFDENPGKYLSQLHALRQTYLSNN